MTDATDPYALPPVVESERLRSLGQLHMLRGQPEDRFAHVTRMALVALGVPMSAINLMERDSQWCKQFSGAGDPDFDVSRDQSVCRATIARAYGEPEDPALIFEDLAASEFAELPAVAAEGGVRFYAGFPCTGRADTRWGPSAFTTPNLCSDDLPLGVDFEGSWTTRRAVMQPGDTLVVASDGLLDLLGEKAVVGDAFEFLASYADPSEMCAAVSALAERLPPIDDVTVVAVRRNGRREER